MKKSMTVVLFTLLLGVAVACLLGTILFGVFRSGGHDEPSTVPRGASLSRGTAVPSAPYQGVSPKTASPEATEDKPAYDIPANTLVHVGEDIPAGTYRAIFPADAGEKLGLTGDCYWKKSSDAEGRDVLANDIVHGGRAQVTLKKGQWFVSKDCGEWRRNRG